MIQFALISDIHLDFWLKHRDPTSADNLWEIKLFAESLLPGRSGAPLQAKPELLCALKRYYTHILLVAGNHDYYLVNSRNATSCRPRYTVGWR